jgi:NAD(P) transhydrogenase
LTAAVARYDVLVIGAGPAGQKAAVQAAKVGKRTLVVERSEGIGGECVHRGTIPSKTLRQVAVHLSSLEQGVADEVGLELGPQTKLASLMRRCGEVLSGASATLEEQLARNGIEIWRGRARFLSPQEVEVSVLDGSTRHVHAGIVVITTGSRPRQPSDIAIDHESILDSDSILSLIYLPTSLAVLGSGVIACEFASIFQAFGVAVTMIDKAERPLGFLERELTDVFLARFEAQGGRFLPRSRHERVQADGLGGVRLDLAGRESLRVEKCLVALGRTASLGGLALERAGLAADSRGFLVVDEHCRTVVPHIYAAGDVIGPPALAASAMEQGRRAMRHALGLEAGLARDTLPTGIYTIPEMACVGLSEEQGVARHGSVLVGRARFAEIMRGRIQGDLHGLLKLVADASGKEILGAHIVGEGATELVHLAQVAMLGKLPVDAFVDTIFNFPTLAEAYRVAALEVLGRRAALVGEARS